MKTVREIKWSRPTRRPDGHLGARARISITKGGGCDGHYAFSTHGLSSAQAAARVLAIESFHAARASRMHGFRALQSVEFVVGSEEYRIVDLTIRYPEDASSCSVFVDVRRITGGAQEKVEGFPKLWKFGGPADIPTDTELLNRVRAGLPDIAAVEAAHEAYLLKVDERLVGGA